MHGRKHISWAAPPSPTNPLMHGRKHISWAAPPSPTNPLMHRRRHISWAAPPSPTNPLMHRRRHLRGALVRFDPAPPKFHTVHHFKQHSQYVAVFVCTGFRVPVFFLLLKIYSIIFSRGCVDPFGCVLVRSKLPGSAQGYKVAYSFSVTSCVAPFCWVLVRSIVLCTFRRLLKLNK